MLLRWEWATLAQSSSRPPADCLVSQIMVHLRYPVCPTRPPARQSCLAGLPGERTPRTRSMAAARTTAS